MTNHTSDRRKYAAKYARLRKIGDRAGAKKVWLRLFAATNALLGGQE